MKFKLREYHTTNTLVFRFHTTFLGRSILITPVVKLVTTCDTYSKHFLLIVLSRLLFTSGSSNIELRVIVWDPHNKPKLMLKKIELLATRIASKEWHGQSETLNVQFNLRILLLCHMSLF